MYDGKGKKGSFKIILVFYFKNVTEDWFQLKFKIIRDNKAILGINSYSLNY